MGPIPEAWLMKTDEDKAKVTFNYITNILENKFLMSFLNSNVSIFPIFFFSFFQIEKIDQEMTKLIPLEKDWKERCLKRDRNLAALAKLKRELKDN